MRKRLSNIILTIMFITGLSLLLYPTVSDYWNSMHQSRAIAGYEKAVADISPEEYERIWKEAEDYNTSLITKEDRFSLSESEKKKEEKILNVSENGIIGYIEIPRIRCRLPIYHGTDEGILQTSIGHIEGTSFPVGGESTHCVLSGHRGLPSAKLFSNLDMLQEGDVFMLKVLDKILTYEVDNTLIVEPHELDALDIKKGKDYCTLVTCTPYGVNTHRLLVRGHRVENGDYAFAAGVPVDAIQIEPVLVAPIAAIPMILLLLIWELFIRKK